MAVLSCVLFAPVLRYFCVPSQKRLEQKSDLAATPAGTSATPVATPKVIVGSISGQGTPPTKVVLSTKMGTPITFQQNKNFQQSFATWVKQGQSTQGIIRLLLQIIASERGCSIPSILKHVPRLLYYLSGSRLGDHHDIIQRANLPDYRNVGGWKSSDHQALGARQQQDRHSQRANFTRRYGGFAFHRQRVYVLLPPLGFLNTTLCFLVCVIYWRGCLPSLHRPGEPPPLYFGNLGSKLVLYPSKDTYR